MEEYIQFMPEMMVQVRLKHPDDFLKVKETLTRMGIQSRGRDRKLFQSCFILSKRNYETNEKCYYIVHFKEMFGLDGCETTIVKNDLRRRNTIAKLLHEWGLVELVYDIPEEDCVSVNEIKIISFNEKNDWELISKYPIGQRRR